MEGWDSPSAFGVVGAALQAAAAAMDASGISP